MNETQPVRRAFLLAGAGLLVLLGSSPVTAAGGDSLRLVVPSLYLPNVPTLVRVELRNAAGEVRRDVWDAEANLTADDPGAGLSAGPVVLKNGLGSALVTLSGGTTPELTASYGALQARRWLTNAVGQPVVRVGGTLPGNNTVWSGVVQVTNDVVVPVGHTLKVDPGALVLFAGVDSGTGGADLIVQGRVLAMGTEEQPVTFTCAEPGRRWGQIRHDNAAPSVYAHAVITRAGRAPGEGHTGTGPVIRPSGSTLTFWDCSLTDHADASGTPGKIMMATGSDLTLVDCLMARARMGPEITGTAVRCLNTWILEMRGPDDADGIYIHEQAAGQEARLSGCVIAGGDDDALDTYGSDVLVEDCILRDWVNPAEDAKGISVFHGETRVERSLIANCFVGISAKSSGPLARVFLEQSTVTGVTWGLSATYKDNATAGNIDFRVTNCIVQAPEALRSDFAATNLTAGFCNLSTAWPGTGNFVADPRWIDAATNYNLGVGSPCIDAGNPAWGGDPDGTRADVGAFPRLTSRTVVAESGVVISEIMYHPASEDVREEYVELWNRGTNATNVSGWRFSRGIDFAFPTNTTIAAGGFLVVAADADRFRAKYPGVSPVVGNWRGLLSNSHEDLELEDAAGNRIDRVQYADEGDWAVRRRGPVDHGHRGWDWFCAHDGLGSSAELVQPALENDLGSNWAPSLIPEGTPGAPNSRAETDAAPLLREVEFAPLLPRSVDEVRVTARVDDEDWPAEVWLSYRPDGPESVPFLRRAMFDDGRHEDGLAGDGLYAGTIPPQPDLAVVEFFVSAVDAAGQGRTWPAPAEDQDGAALGQAANVLYQVQDAPEQVGQPLFRIILREADQAELAFIGSVNPDADSDAQMNASFLSAEGGTPVLRPLVGIRNRGHGTRDLQPNNYRVNFRSDDPWNGVTALNINGQFTHAQHFGATLALRSGVAGGAARGVQVRLNQLNLGNNGPQTYGSTYVANEVIDSSFADHRFPFDSSGNVYRCIRTDTTPRINADLAYRGPDSQAYTNTYFKQTNVSEDDWTDLIELTRVLTETPDAEFLPEVRRVIDVDQWLRHLAVMALFNSRESGLNTGNGDDYALYRGVSDPRFQLLFYDLDTIVGQGNTAGSTTDGVFGAASIPAFGRLLNHPELRTRYYQTLAHLLDTTFSAAQFDSLMDQTLGDYVPAAARTGMKDWMTARRQHVRSLLPAGLPPYESPRALVSGVPRSPTPWRSATLSVAGDGLTHYRYALNGAAFGAETAVALPIQLVNLPDNSTNQVRVVGRNADGVWQDDASATLSAVWVVRVGWPTVRLNEVFARNDLAFNHEGTYPDCIELYNEGASAVDLSGLRLSDAPSNPGKFVFPPSTVLGPGAYLVVLANDPDGTAGLHAGFGLSQDGDGVYLFDTVDRGGALLDQVVFGLQLADRSLGRTAGGDWVLNEPTLGEPNAAAVLAPADELRLNEWLAADGVLWTTDFVEVYNPAGAPVALGGLSLSDNLVSAPFLSPLPALSFLDAGAYRAFWADGDATRGGDHLAFRLAAEYGEIGLQADSGRAIDSVFYGPQTGDVSQGRSPNGSDALQFFFLPTPGGPNVDLPSTSVTVTNVLVPMEAVWSYDQTEDLTGVSWMQPGFDDSEWPEGGALLYLEESALPAAKTTLLTLGRNAYYFRTHFQYTPEAGDLALRLNLILDDGAVIYLNGEELLRWRMPLTGDIVYETPADPSVNNAALEGPLAVASSALRSGDNVLAVEVHQSGPGSTDVVFGLALESVVTRTSGSSAPVLISEVFSSGRSFTNLTDRPIDWMELYNPRTTPVDLSGIGLSDSADQPPRWVVPAGTTLAPGAYLTVGCDPDAPASTNNTGFGLRANGGAVFLFAAEAEGGGLLDSLQYGLQVPDYALARLPAGGGSWNLALPTPGGPNLAATLADRRALRINEWQSATPNGQDWFELYNPALQPAPLGGTALTDDLADRTRSPLPPLSFIGAGRDGYLKLIADGDRARGADHVGFSLSADGDEIGLYAPDQSLIAAVAFGRQSAEASQGSLPDGAAMRVEFIETASPGAGNYLPEPDVVINEVLTHSDPPLEDAVEIHNRSSLAVDVGGWFLSDDAFQLRKYQIPRPTLLPPGGYAVLYEGQFNADTNNPTAFALSSAYGDDLHLSRVDAEGQLTGYRATVAFGPSANGVSFGRFPTSVGTDFVAMAGRTFGRDTPSTVEEFRLGTGGANAIARVGPVIFSEIHYHPPDLPGGLDDIEGEYLELENITAEAVPLYDPLAATNTWRVDGGVRFEFPPAAELPAGGRLLLVSFSPLQDPAALARFRGRYGLSPGVAVLGPYAGKLENDRERLALYRPDPPQVPGAPDAGYVPYVLVEAVQYADVVPWPVLADGTAASLQRAIPSAYGNDPAHWLAADPTPGQANAGGPADADGDGLPDDWEILNGLDPGSGLGADGALGDPDGDGVGNLNEYQAGTPPNTADRVFRLQVAVDDLGRAQLSFPTVAGRSYSVQARDQVDAGPWESLENVPAEPQHGSLLWVDPTVVPQSSRYYRVVTPAQP